MIALWGKEQKAALFRSGDEEEVTAYSDALDDLLEMRNDYVDRQQEQQAAEQQQHNQDAAVEEGMVAATLRTGQRAPSTPRTAPSPSPARSTNRGDRILDLLDRLTQSVESVAQALNSRKRRISSDE